MQAQALQANSSGSAASQIMEQFFSAFREEVARPLFAAKTESEFDAIVSELVMTGSVLRFRMLVDVFLLPQEERPNWTVDFPSGKGIAILERAAVLLGEERSFQLERALAITFKDIVELSPQLARKVEKITPSRLVHLAASAKACAIQDVLCLAWLMALQEEFPFPSMNMAHHAAERLFKATAHRYEAMMAVLEDAPVTTSEFSGVGHKDWLGEHPRLHLPFIFLLGLVAGEKGAQKVKICIDDDPEIPGASMLSLVVMAEQPDLVRERLEIAALETGVLGAMTDGNSSLVLVVTAA